MADTKLFLGNDSGIPIPGVGLLKTTEDDALFLDNIREIANLSMMRKEYNTIIHCRNGRILVEVGGNQQIKVPPSTQTPTFKRGSGGNARKSSACCWDSVHREAPSP